MARLDRKEFEKFELVTGLESHHLEKMAGCASNVLFKKGSYLAREKAKANSLYMIRSGKVVVRLSSSGEEPLDLQVVKDGGIIGWSWLFPPHAWKFDVYALEDTRVIEFNGDCMRKLCEMDHELGYSLMKKFAELMTERLKYTRMQLIGYYRKYL